MSKRLIDNVNSQYFDAANHMRPKWKQMKVIAYVESYDDIFFWREVLGEFETPQLGFEVVLPSRTRLMRGKKAAIMNNLGKSLGTSMIACVDADYDYLMQGASPSSRDLLNNPFVVHTQVYSIENYQCYAPSLHHVCVMSTLNDHRILDFEAYLTTFSRIVYDIFVWSVWMHRQNLAYQFPMSSMSNIITVHKVNIYNPEPALEELRRACNRKLAWLQRNFPKAKGKLAPLKDELQRLGVTPDNTYLYIQGHHIMDNVVMEVLTPICNTLRRQREKEIKQCAEHPQQMDNELSSYQHSQLPIDAALRRNTAFKDLPEYQRLRENIQRLVGRICG